MANKQVKYTFGGANQDIAKSKHPFQYYFDAQHIRITSTDTQSTGELTNEKGTELIISLPATTIFGINDLVTPAKAGTIEYGTKSILFTTSGEIDTQLDADLLPRYTNEHIIIGHTTTRDAIIIFSTSNTGMDCIWRLNNVLTGEYDLELIYVRHLSFSVNNPIQAIFNYENENIQKVYWVDGKQQIRAINLNHTSIEGNDSLIDISSSSINFVGTVDFSQPIIKDVVSGGTHTAGMIQYAYNLFRLNSSQTKLSPLSELVSLDKGNNLGGGALNEVVGAIPIIEIANIDSSYDYIRVYAIKYTSYGEIPSISLIEEKEIDADGSLLLYDDGSTISSLTLEELIFLGSNPIIPKHIESKDNRLFMANIQSSEFLLPKELDCRAYSFGLNAQTTNIYKDIVLNPTTNITSGSKLTVTNSFIVPTNHDAINLDYDGLKYKFNSSILGATGKFIELEIVQKSLDKPEEYRLLKDREIYRFGITFYNNLGQTSLPQWTCDYKMPSGNLQGNYNTIKVNLTSAFYTWLNSYNFSSESEKPVGYTVIRADRTLNDRTIMCQGVIGGMMISSPRDSQGATLYTVPEKRNDSDVQVKIPNFLLRTFEEVVPLKPNLHLAVMQAGAANSSKTNNFFTEVQYSPSQRAADVYQYTAMYQMYSPEIMFDSVSLSTSTQLRVVGGLQNTYNAWWGQRRIIASKVVAVEGKALNKLSPHASGGSNLSLNGSVLSIVDRGMISDPNGSTPDVDLTFNQYIREFTTFINSPTSKIYNIYGSPELTVRGQGRTVYNNNSKYTYSNTLEGFLSDGEDSFVKDGELSRAIISINSYGAKNYTFVLDRGDNEDIPSYNRILMENLYTQSGINNTSSILVTEFIRPLNDIYFSGIYSGISYEDKRRTKYLQIGTYTDIGTSEVTIDNAGDTYVQTFKFLRIGKTDVEVYSTGVVQLSEIVSVKLETTVDLKNRNDLSSSTWDSRFQPTYNEYHEYNRVYSQQPTLIKTTNLESTFRRVENFDTRVQATKLKIPNESIDSWTDILENEVLDLNGKFGPINNIMSFNDEVYAFQDEAISKIIINPRVQIQANDGVGIELGTGSVLYNYNYLTTSSGSINKWGITSTKRGIYYYDALNKGIGRVPDAVGMSLTDTKGFHTYFNNNYDYTTLRKDNPILGTGVLFGKDNYNNDVYFTFLQGDKSFTRCFNELLDQFVDLKVYNPSMYINKGERLISIPSNTTPTIYEHNKGLYNHFYGEYAPSYIILQVNPESDISCVFDSVFFNSELYLKDIDQPDKTLTSIQAYSEYQNSGKIPLVVGRDKNLRRKFREWKAEIPRDGRNRIRNPWIFLKLELDNTSNYKLILHDITISYTV